ncbi:MAG: hypothetical protein M3472_06530, partial [Chloroflexota bacterium]|nr:hypothetical protein [Chloroflexota bacterium]
MRQNVLEWAALAISAVAIGLVAVLLVVEGLGTMSAADPALTLRPEEGRAVALGWSVPGTMSNTGRDAAEAVVIEASATVDGVEETSEIEVMFLPGGSSVDVEFGFSGQPEGEISARLVGYRVP